MACLRIRTEVKKMGLKEKSRKSKLGGKPTSIDALGGLFRPRTRPDLAVALSLVFFALVGLVFVSYASAADPGHPASSISASTFESGDFAFPNNLSVAGNMTADAGTLYVDAAHNWAGIGTTNPRVSLHVVNTTAGVNELLRLSYANSIASGARISWYAAEATTETARIENYIDASNQASLRFYTFNSGIGERMRIDPAGNVTIDSGTLYVDAAHDTVGIGTANPTYKLQVLTGTNTYALYTSDSVVTTSIFNGLAGGSTGGWIGTQTNHPLYFQTVGSAPQMTIQNNTGNVGIGTTNPADTLTVAGTLNVTNIELATDCSDGDVLKWSGGVGTCGTDTGTGGNTTEEMQDAAGALLGGTETLITVTYDDAGNDIDFVVPEMRNTTQEMFNAANNGSFIGSGNATVGRWNSWANNYTACTSTQKLYFNGYSLACASDANTYNTTQEMFNAANNGSFIGSGNATVDRWNSWANNYTACSSSQKLYFNGRTLACNDDSGIGAETDPQWSGNVTTCASNQKLYFNGRTLACASDIYNTTLQIWSVVDNGTFINSGNATVDRWNSWANNYTACSSSQKLYFNGRTLACAADDTGTASGWTTSGNYIYNSSTSVMVGIGTASPGTALDVYGSISGSGLLTQTFSNIKKNGGWESGTTDGWVVGAGAANPGGEIALNTSVVHTGNYSYRVYNSTSYCNSYLYEDFDVRNTTNISVSGWVRALTSGFNTSGASIFIAEGTGAGCTQWARMTNGGFINLPSNWTQLSIEGWNSQVCTRIRVGFTVQGCSVSGDAYFDDLMVTEGDSPKDFYQRPIVDSYTGNQWIIGGNVGIGTSNPADTLTVSGTVNATDFECSAGDCIGAAEIDSSNLATECSTITGSLDLCDDDDTCSDEACTVGSDDSLNNPTVAAALSMANYAITNIGNAATDFSADGGLTLNGNLSTLGTSHTISGNVSFDGGTLVVDAPHNYVGIGTSAPGYPLHVVSTGVFPAVIQSSNSAWAGFEQRATTSKARPYIQLYNSADDKKAWLDVDPENATFNIYHNGSYRMTINGSGNVGIGTIRPADTLTVAGTLNVTNIELATDCSDGDVLKWSGGVGTCGTDTGTGGNTTEEMQDAAGALLGGTETLITVTYDDAGNDIDFVVPEMRNTTQEMFNAANNGSFIGSGNATVGRWNSWFNNYTACTSTQKLYFNGYSLACANDANTYNTTQEMFNAANNGSFIGSGNATVSRWNSWANNYTACTSTQKLYFTGTSLACADDLTGGGGWTTSGNYVYNNTAAASVGIGTATPTKKLDISDGTKAITFDPAASTPTINTTAAYNLTITSSGGNVIIQLG